jgi:ribosomal-protein-alanine acetyltransferase
MAEDSPRLRTGNTDLRIRKAQSSDIDDLVRLEAKAFSSDRLTRRRLWAHLRSERSSLLIIEQGGKLAGYALVLVRRGSAAARLYSLAVHPRATGQGIGSRLLAAAESAARGLGATSLRLEVRVDNASAIRLYERNGYRTIGRREDYYADGAAAFRYARDLRRPGRRRNVNGLRQAA